MTVPVRVVRLSEVAAEAGAHGLAALLRSADDHIRRDTSLLVTPEQTAGETLTVGHTVVYPGCSTRGHAHADREEVYLIVRGRGVVTVGDQSFDVQADDALYLPPGPYHTARNHYSVPLEYFWITVARKTG